MITEIAAEVETAAMGRAVELSRAALGTTSPNPPVGCVVLDTSGRVVGEGAHVGGPGHPHAEAVALARAGLAARGGTAVVTLEPCAHTGQTPPCVRALLAAGVRRVRYAVPDPNPVAAGGAGALAAAGVDVAGGLLEGAALDVLRPWLHAVRTGRPFVTWKVASTLDGRVAAADGSSRWITGPSARADVHRLRGECDAIMVGIGTALADDPELTVRRPDGSPAERQPLRVVLDSDGRLPAGAKLLGERSLVLTAAGGAGPTTARVPRDPSGGLDLTAALAVLFERGVRHVLCEGGPRLAAGLLAAGLVDQVVVYLAPKLLGAGPSALADFGVTGITQALDLHVYDVAALAPDVRIIAHLEREEN